MLIVAPPSETKRPPPDSGPPVDLDALSFPELTPMRRRVLDALATTSAGADALRRLHAPPSKMLEVARNTVILDVPAMAASDVYSGPLHQGLSIASLSPAAQARADQTMVITSPLWGLLRPSDRIPPYRLYLFSRLAEMRRMDHEWRDVLPKLLTTVARPERLILDLRSPESQSIGMPIGVDERIVMLRVRHHVYGRRIGDVVAKRVRGEAAHDLLESGATPRSPDELASILGEHWPVELSPGARGATTLTLTTDD